MVINIDFVAKATLRMVNKLLVDEKRFYKEYSLLNGIDKAANDIVKSI